MANFSGSIQLCSGHHPAQRGTSCPDLCPACHSSLKLPAAALAAVPFTRPCQGPSPLREVSRASAGQKALPLCWPSPRSSCSVLTAAHCLFATNTRLSH